MSRRTNVSAGLTPTDNTLNRGWEGISQTPLFTRKVNTADVARWAVRRDFAFFRFWQPLKRRARPREAMRPHVTAALPIQVRRAGARELAPLNIPLQSRVSALKDAADDS